MPSSYDLILVLLLAGPGGPAKGPAWLDREGERVASALPDDFHAHASRRCREMGLYNPAQELSPADARAEGSDIGRLADVGFLNIMRGRYKGRRVPGDPGLPPQPGGGD